MDTFTNVQVDFNEIPVSAELSYVPLHQNFMYIILSNALIFFVIILILLTGLWTVIDEPWYQNNFQWILLGILLLFLLHFSYAFKAFGFKGYAFRQKDISYKTGWLWRSVTTVPFNRVQHCEVSQGVLDRSFGLARLKIFTAGGSSSDMVVPGLELEQAIDLKDYILEKIKEDE